MPAWILDKAGMLKKLQTILGDGYFNTQNTR